MISDSAGANQVSIVEMANTDTLCVYSPDWVNINLKQKSITDTKVSQNKTENFQNFINC